MTGGAGKQTPNANASRTQVTIFVCQSCGIESNGGKPSAPSAGESLLADLQARNCASDRITITGVDCLAVCEQPVTISFAAPGKWTYIIGDVAPTTSTDDILSAAEAVASSRYGVPEMKDRPTFFRNGVVARTPPAGWTLP